LHQQGALGSDHGGAKSENDAEDGHRDADVGAEAVAMAGMGDVF
jgi:hypothetical protein